ncbi:hypothetical protein DSO57_1006794 [Entomophthora muscae]|uniref:Uncharacterized protein n=1 Tax=Entomophthora muscae TaxID=34485 RepID=A0ACC2S9Q3_9FUNG|nr:hypothetical protein DSO57_1006794 [Entomophthora muscae]
MYPPLETGLENPTPTINWQNSSPNDPHQKESLANGWFKYPSGHWGRKFHYGRHSTPPPAKPLLVQPHTSFYLLTYMLPDGKVAYLGHLGHLAMVIVPIGSAITGLNLGALAHQIGGFFPLKWVPDISNVIRHLNQVPTNLASYVLFPWSASYLERLSPPP